MCCYTYIQISVVKQQHKMAAMGKGGYQCPCHFSGHLMKVPEEVMKPFPLCAVFHDMIFNNNMVPHLHTEPLGMLY